MLLWPLGAARLAPRMSAKKWEHKRFGDPTVPGQFVRLSKTAVSILDTPHFQRLRHLKQLGFCDLVYPSATHSRFAHSLGVAHRAREMLRALQQRQPELGITDADLQVVEVAGLCHDLGHGPFSHAFESELVPRIMPGKHWSHEKMSCTVFDHICAHYETGLDAEQQQRVKDLISSGHSEPEADWGGKSFMFDIVANKRNGLDVDKFDYLKRDNTAIGEMTASDFSVLFESMRVIRGQVCFKDSRRSVVGDVYAARARLHEQVYTHPVVKALELMVVDALALVADELGIPAALQDPDKFALLDDSIVREVERSHSRTPEMKRAQQLLHRLRVRDIYKICSEATVPRDKLLSFPRVTEEDLLEYQDESCGITLLPSDIRVHNLLIDYTMKSQNPLERVGFYYSDSDTDFFTQPDTLFAPGTYMSKSVRVYLVRVSESEEEKRRYIGAVQAAFEAWNEQVLRAERWRSPQKSAFTAADRLRASPLKLPRLELPQPPAPAPGPAAVPAAAEGAGAAAAGGAGQGLPLRPSLSRAASESGPASGSGLTGGGTVGGGTVGSGTVGGGGGSTVDPAAAGASPPAAAAELLAAVGRGAGWELGGGTERAAGAAAGGHQEQQEQQRQQHAGQQQQQQQYEPPPPPQQQQQQRGEQELAGVGSGAAPGAPPGNPPPRAPRARRQLLQTSGSPPG